MAWIFLLGIYIVPPIVAAIVASRRGIKIDQKKSAGIDACIIIFILSFLMSLMVAFIAAISGPSPDEAIKGPSNLRLLPIFFPTVISISTVGLWHRQKWGRICSLFVATVITITMAYIFYSSLFLMPKKIALQNCVSAAIFAIIGMVFISIIYYLTRSKVKDQFK